METTIFDFKAKNNKGEEIDFSVYKDKVLLIVNTASKCGFTPQYKALEQLYKTYKDRGLMVIAFPCNQFAHQESGSDAEIAGFCEMNFGVTFPLMAKIDVNGKNTHPVFHFLKKKAPGFIVSKIKWNFTKFLIDKSGKKVSRYSPMTDPLSLEKEIESLLQVK
ncbi:glutathione peroxidase [uncultured Bacteroides sp.]|uniref:glutathione peroxidase n=1 Tax=uncultured Bacteroides sp. TaxID=162156 RepID=UPI002AABFCAB|nr:glutathione peroxidase [uncultured Bacteroides sp.]